MAHWDHKGYLGATLAYLKGDVWITQKTSNSEFSLSVAYTGVSCPFDFEFWHSRFLSILFHAVWFFFSEFNRYKMLGIVSEVIRCEKPLSAVTTSKTAIATGIPPPQ